MKNYPTLRQLQYLKAIDETKNFGRAAIKCNVTQPTLSSAIKELENILGVLVIDRSQHKKVKITPYGQKLIKSSKEIFKELDGVLQQAIEENKPLSGLFRIGFIPTIAPYLLPQILPLLQNKFKNMQFEIIESVSAQLVEKLDTGDLDLAIMAFPYDLPNLRHAILFEEPFFCAAKKNTFKNKTISLSDLDDHKILLLEDGHCLRDHALTACKLQKREDKNTLSATSLLTLSQMAGQGYGLTLLPKMVMNAGAIPDTVEIYKFSSPAPTRTIGVAWRPYSPIDKNINAVCDFLKKKNEISCILSFSLFFTI